LEEIGLPELTLEQVEELCERAEQAARDYVLSKVPTSRIATLDVTVDAEGTKPITANVEVTVVHITFSLLSSRFDLPKQFFAFNLANILKS